MGKVNIIKKEIYNSTHTLYLMRTFLFLLFCITSLFGCTQSLPDGLRGNHYHPETGWVNNNPQHDDIFKMNPENCIACHGSDLNGGQSGASCVSCHHDWGPPEDPLHGSKFTKNSNICKGCHGQNLNGGITKASCLLCHHNGGWNNISDHGATSYEKIEICIACHGEESNSGLVDVSCKSCHHSSWSGSHGSAFTESPDKCKLCHGDEFNGPTQAGSCADCHHDWGNPADPQHGAEFLKNEKREICKACPRAYSCHPAIIPGQSFNLRLSLPDLRI